MLRTGSVLLNSLSLKYLRFCEQSFREAGSSNIGAHSLKGGVFFWRDDQAVPRPANGGSVWGRRRFIQGCWHSLYIPLITAETLDTALSSGWWMECRAVITYRFSLFFSFPHPSSSFSSSSSFTSFSSSLRWKRCLFPPFISPTSSPFSNPQSQ